MSTQVLSPYPYFTTRNGSSPLNLGYVYIGEPNKDPQTFPQAVFWDAEMTLPAAQPLRTDGGYIVNGGDPSPIYTAGAFSIRVRANSGGTPGTQVFFRTEVPDPLGDYVTLDGTQTLTNKDFANPTDFYGGRFTFSSEAFPLSPRVATVDIRNNDDAGVGLHVRSYWTGTTAAPYNNNDTLLTETYNNITSNSLNRSWGASLNNAYNNIPAGVTDSGERVGVIGWAPSVMASGYIHAGTLDSQRGVLGTAGFQGAGSPATAVVNASTGVAGLVYTDSPGATIVTAQGGLFVSDGKGLDGTPATASIIQNNYAVYARAQNGTVSNWSFFGELGKLFNEHQIISGTPGLATQSSSAISARKNGNGVEFGHTDATGYGSNIGSTFASGLPFVAFSAEADPTGDTFRTRGKVGNVVYSNLAGQLRFARITNPNASGQTPELDAAFNNNGQFALQKTIVLSTRTPATATATGVAGEFCWDAGFLYICVAANTWRRVAVATW